MSIILFVMLIGQSPAAEPVPESPEAETSAETNPAEPVADRGDELLRRQYESLRTFADGGELAALDTYFDVDLDDPVAIRERISGLKQRVSAGDGGEQLRVDELRLNLLSEWQGILERMSGPALQAMKRLREPQRALRASARRLEQLEAPLATLARDLDRKVAKAESGGIIGFRTDVSEFVDAAQVSAAAFRASATSVRTQSASLLRAATQLENKGVSIRERFLSAGLRGRGADVDREFESAVSAQRTLRRAVRQLNVAGFERAVTRALDELPATAEKLRAATDVRAAQAALTEADTELAEVNGRLGEAQRIGSFYELELQGEAVAMLTAVASEAARDRAYPLGTELIGDIESEAKELWASAKSYVQNQTDRLTDRLVLYELAPTVLVVLLILVLGSLLEKRAARAVSLLVKPFARTRAFRGRVGTLVRWAGWFQAIAPTLVRVIAGYLVFFAIGFDRVEVQFLEIGFRWFSLYFLGQSALLGAVRQVSAGRPALIEVSSETRSKLLRSYRQVGSVLAVATTVEELARTLLALGRLRSLIEIVVVAFTTVWLLYACLTWREAVAARLVSTSAPDSVVSKIGRWMAENYAGAVLVIPATVWLLSLWAWSVISVVLLQQGVFAYFKAIELRRQAKGAGGKDALVDAALPDVYATQFPLYPVLGEIDSVLLQQPDEVDPILSQINAWKAARRDSSLAIVGAKGIGKTTMMALVRGRITEAEVVSCSLTERLLEESDVVRVVAPIFDAGDASTLQELSAALNDGPDRVAIIDDAHLAFLRVVDGYRGFDALVDLVTQTSARVFWLLTFNDYAWAFLNAAHGRRAYFRRIRRIQDWSSEELRDLIGRRTARAGFDLEFDQHLLDDGWSDDGPDLRIIEGAEGFFRMLWEASRGNPRAATSLWLRSLTLKTEKALRVQLFSDEKTEALKSASDDVFFALASITQHENLTADELTQTLNANESVSTYALRYLSEYGIIGPKFGAPDRYTVQVRHYWEVVQALRARNQLYRESQ